MADENISFFFYLSNVWDTQSSDFIRIFNVIQQSSQMTANHTIQPDRDFKSNATQSGYDIKLSVLMRYSKTSLSMCRVD